MVRYQLLESRTLLSVDVQLRGWTLLIDGSNDADQIVITQPTQRTICVQSDSMRRHFSASRVRLIFARLGAGDDLFSAENIRKPVRLNADDGDDTVVTGAGIDTILAGNGDDSVRAGFGQDLIHAGEGNDTVFGEAGSDTLFGDAGNDQLVGGADYDVIRGLLGRDRFDTSEWYTTEVFDYSPRLDVPV